MAIDPSIALGVKSAQLESPVNQLAQLLQVQSAQQQNQLGQAKLDEYQRGTERTNRLQALLGSFAPDAKPDDQVGALTRGGFLPEARSLAESSAKVATEKRAAEKAQLEAMSQKLALGAQILGTAKDQASYDAARATAQQAGLDVSNMPPQFDAAFVQAKRTEGLTALQQLEQHWKQQNYDLDLKKADETARHNGATEKSAAGQLAVSQGQLGIAQQREKREAAAPQSQYDADRSVLVDKRTGIARPVIGADGKPLQAGAKMTEDQAKATGWLVQAENAWKNMQAVGVGKDGKPTDAAKPGRIETALSSAIPFGAGEAAANSWRNADRQKFLQGASSLSEALLRAATGAGVNKDEAAQKVRELTPVWGDTDENIKQKMDSIPLYIESLKVRSGPGAVKAATVLSNPSGAAAVPDDIAALLKKHGGK